MYVANVYRVMIASPGDVQAEREIAKKVILEWNELHSAHRGIVLLPLLWEYNTIPEHGRRPQGIINDQILRHADLLVGIFWMRIGSLTGKAISGTVEELESHMGQGKPAMLYFSRANLPQNYDREQFEALQDFKGEAQKNGLYATFSSNADFERDFRNHLAQKLNDTRTFSEYMERPAASVNEVMPVKSADFTAEARLLLVALAQSKSGQIMETYSKSGLSIQVDRNQFVGDQSPRVVAKWRGAVLFLKNGGYIRQIIKSTVYSTIFEITDLGFDKADLYIN